MNRTTKPSTGGDGLRRVYKPSIIISPSARKAASSADVLFGLQSHRDLDSLPFGFLGRRGKKFMVVTTADLTKTMVVLATELNDFTKDVEVRQLNERTALESLEVAEKITCEAGNDEAWICLCDNTPTSDGFFPCDVEGNEMEPIKGSNWDELYVCGRCGRIIHQSTLEVHGQNPDWKPLP